MSESPQDPQDSERQGDEAFSGRELAEELARGPNRRTLRAMYQDGRGIVADTYLAEHQPRTLEKPEKGAGLAMQAMHLMHVAANKLGERVNRNYDRKTPAWPLPAEAPANISVLGFGAERVAYNVHLDDGQDVVVGVFHGAGMLHDAHEVALKKKANYDIYRQYFGDQVVPTAYLEIENPWGEGRKAATLQKHLGETQKLGDFSMEDLTARANADPQFAQQLGILQSGFRAMLADGRCPDLASSNVLIRGSNILLPDTGRLFEVKRLERLRKIHRTYSMIEGLQL